MRSNAWSDPPRSATGCTNITRPGRCRSSPRLPWARRMRIALNVEQLLQPSPGGIGRYSAALASLLPQLFPHDEVIPFAAWHRGAALRAAAGAAGCPPIRRLTLPRPALYEVWHRSGSLGGL